MGPGNRGSLGSVVPFSLLTLLGHPHFQALLQPTILAAVAGDLVDLTVLVSVAGVHHVLLDTAAEEALEGGLRHREREVNALRSLN